MKYFVVLPVVLCLTLSNLIAQLTVKTTKTFPTYQTGETASFQITSSFGGSATYQFVYDDYKELGPEMPIQLTAGVPASVTQTIYQPGVITCKVKQAGTTARGAALFNHTQIQPARTEPADFDAFWNAQKQALAQVPISPQIAYHSESSTSTTYKVSLGHIDNRRVYGWLSVPKGGTSYPAIINFPSFGGGTISPVPYLADQLGCLAFALTIHNAPPDQVDPQAYLPNDPSSATGIYYRYAILAGLRAIDYIATRPDFNGTEIAVTGESQGGGLSVMVAGLDNRVDLCITGIDALAEHSAWLDGKASSFPYYLQTASYSNNQNQIASVANAVKYYDAIYFQKRFQGESTCTVGHRDEICPPATIIAKNNQATKKMVTFHAIENGHTTPVYFWKAMPDFIRSHFPSTNTPVNNPWIPATKGYEFSVNQTQSIAANNGLFLSGSFTHDGLAISGATAKWEKISGSGNAQFNNANTINPTVTFSADDVYVLKVTLTDQSRAASDKIITEYVDFVQVTVGAGGSGGGGNGGGGNGGGGGTTTLCASAGQEPWWQWISKVKINTYEHISLKEGYANYANFTIALPSGSTANVALTPGYSFTQYTESWRIWADWNQDNDFTDAGELVFDLVGANAVTGTFSVPQGLEGKQIKMRVAMKNGTAPQPCETFQYGEVEDYVLSITQSTNPQPCTITATNTNPVCQQNGTPLIGSDDTWSVSITATNAVSGLSQYNLSYNGVTIGGNYNTPLQVTGLPFTGASQTFVLSDVTNSGCTQTLTVTPPAPCAQQQPCTITATNTNPVCQQNGTPLIGSDDTWSVSITATNSLAGLSQYNLSYNGVTISGNYNTPLQVTGLPFTGASQTFVLSDVTNSGCTQTLTVTPPAPCAQQQLCTITATNTNPVCQQNGTPFIGSDDTWSVSITATNSLAGLSQYNLSYNGVTISGNYNTPLQVTGLPFTGANQAFVLSDATNSGCTQTLTVTPPSPCVQQQQPCTINYQEISKQCQTNGTPTVASDDTWLLTFRVTNNNTSLSQFTYNHGGVVSQGTYGQTLTIQRPMNGQNLSLNFADQNTTNCSRTVTVVPPAPCVVNNPCSINYTLVSKVCNQNGTPSQASDDTWTLTFRASNQNTSLTSYTLTYNGQQQQGTYGVSRSITLPMASSSVSINFTDNTQGCTLPVTVNAPAPCVTVLPPSPTTYCPITSSYPWEEWIAGVRLGTTWIKYSSKEGYADFTSTVGTLKPGQNEIRVLNQFSFITSVIYTKVWIDSNKDGQFSSNELVVNRSTSAPTSRSLATSTMISSFNVPNNWFNGTTRMRVICSNIPIIDGCTNITRGEVEDYTVTFSNTALLSSPDSDSDQTNALTLEPMVLYPNPAHDVAHLVTSQFLRQNLTIQVVGIDNRLHYTQEIEDLRSELVEIPVATLTPGIYIVRVLLEGERPQSKKLIVQSNW